MSDSQAKFVYFEDDMFFVNACPATEEVQVALDSENNIAKAKIICNKSVTTLTPMALKDAIAAELLGPAGQDLLGTKKQRVDQLSSYIKDLKQSIANLNNEIDQVEFDEIKAVMTATREEAAQTLRKAEEESLALVAASNDPEKLKRIDINSTLSLQSELATTADQQAAIFTAMLRDVKMYRLTDKRDSILIKITEALAPTCSFGLNVNAPSTVRVGIEDIKYECQADNKPRILSTTCALEGYERIDNYCVFTGKNMKISSLAAADNGLCAASQGGRLSCWGQTGAFPMTASMISNPVGPVSSSVVFADKVALSNDHICTLASDGSVLRCWNNIDAPRGIPFNQVSSGSGHFCGVTSAGSVNCWGEGAYHQTTGPTALGTIQYLSTNGNVNCAIDSASAMECWGERLENVGYINKVAPTGIGEVLSVSVGLQHICALLKDRSVKCWDTNYTIAQTPPTDLKDVRLVLAGYYESCAVTTSGSLRCWGLASTVSDYTPAPALQDVHSLTASRNGNNICAIYGRQNQVSCWGSRYYKSSYSIVPPSTLADVKEVVITSSGYACAAQNSATVTCWGNEQNIDKKAPKAFSIKSN